jgi:hypothetical protein
MQGRKTLIQLQVTKSLTTPLMHTSLLQQKPKTNIKKVKQIEKST